MDVQKWSHMLCSAPACCVTVRFHYSLEGSDNKGLQTVGRTLADSLLTPSVSPVNHGPVAANWNNMAALCKRHTSATTPHVGAREVNLWPKDQWSDFLFHHSVRVHEAWPHMSLEHFWISCGLSGDRQNKHYLAEWAHQKGWFSFVNGSAEVSPPLWVLLL